MAFNDNSRRKLLYHNHPESMRDFGETRASGQMPPYALRHMTNLQRLAQKLGEKIGSDGQYGARLGGK